jgi:hypothetical protein
VEVFQNAGFVGLLDEPRSRHARMPDWSAACIHALPTSAAGGSWAAAIPTPVRLQVCSENGRPVDPPPTADSCCSFVGSCRRRAPSGTKRKQSVRPLNKIKNLQIYGHARSSPFPPVYSRHSASPRQRLVTLLPEIHSTRKKREDSSPTLSCCSLPHALNPPPLTAVGSQQRTAKTPSPLGPASHK